MLFLDHLENTQVYRRISQFEAFDCQRQLAIKLESVVYDWDENEMISQAKSRFLLKTIDNYQDKPTRFRLTIKVHKQPWATWPIVYFAGTLLNGFSCWIDYWLQQLRPLIPSFIKKIQAAHWQS